MKTTAHREAAQGQHPGAAPVSTTIEQRRERDALGELMLPATALFGIHTQRAVAHLSFSTRALGKYPAYVRGLAYVKLAAVRANAEAGVLEARLAQAIAAAAADLIAGKFSEDLCVDVLGGGGSIGVHMNVNEVLANLANESLGGTRGLYDPIQPKRDVGASQSTADVCHTAARLAVVEQAAPLEQALAALTAALQAKAATFAALPTLARTCLQDAMPTTLGVLFGGYAGQIERRRDAFVRSLEPLHEITLGATVIGSGEGAPTLYRSRIVPILAQVTGRSLRPRNHLADAMQSSDDLRTLSAALASLAETLIKICQDLRLLASGPRGGFGEIVLPHVLEGSSFFGNKRNPVIPETVMQCAFQVLACDRAVQAACEHAELYLNIFDGLAAINLLDAMSMLSQVLPRFDQDCLRDLQADAERCRTLAGLALRPS